MAPGSHGEFAVLEEKKSGSWPPDFPCGGRVEPATGKHRCFSRGQQILESLAKKALQLEKFWGENGSGKKKVLKLISWDSLICNKAYKRSGMKNLPFD